MSLGETHNGPLPGGVVLLDVARPAHHAVSAIQIGRGIRKIHSPPSKCFKNGTATSGRTGSPMELPPPESSRGALGGVVGNWHVVGPGGVNRRPRGLLSARVPIHRTSGGQTKDGRVISNVIGDGNHNGNGLSPGDGYCAAPGHDDELPNCRFFGDLPPRASVSHVARRRFEYVVGGVRIESLQCLDSYKFTTNLKHKFRTMIEISARDGVSNVLLVRGSLLRGFREDGVGKVLQDMVSYWLTNRWPVVVYVGNDRGLGSGLENLFSDVGLPCAPCCSRSLWGPGVHRPGGIHNNVMGLAELVPQCFDCSIPRDAVDIPCGGASASGS